MLKYTYALTAYMSSVVTQKMSTFLFERIRLVSSKLAGSQENLGESLGIKGRTFQGYLTKKREDNLWPHLSQILKLYPQIQRNWLFFGEGNMLEPIVEPIQETKPIVQQAIPLQGFASCDVHGWHGSMSIQVTVSAPLWHDKILAVMASGESMLPAGIGHGQVCYCDPTLEPIEGDAVFVEQCENLSTIKLFCEREERQGKEFIKLKGWLDKTSEIAVQKDFYLSVLSSNIKCIAPVVYVRRRL